LKDLISANVAIHDGYKSLGTETYYGETLTWEVMSYTYGGADGPITGRMYVTVKDGAAYALWFEAPGSDAETTFSTIFEPMVDGFTLSDITA
jgi:hypothetical protein